MRLWVPSFLAFGLAACAAPQAPTAQSETTSKAAASPPADQPAETPVAAESAQPSTHPLLDDRSPDPTHALPRLGIKHVGLHVGGGTGSASERTELLEALEKGQLRVLQCYRLVDRANAGGTFGVDLYVAAAGGRPEVRAVRHKLGGPEFEACMVGALGNVTMGPQARAIVVSYSLRFELSP